MEMVYPERLTNIGYWDGPLTNPGWPAVEDFVDRNWDTEERELIADYLQTGMVARRCMGYSLCRFCGCRNGSLELTDGHFVWPEGLAHYVLEHQVRLPKPFVSHALEMIDNLESAERDELWWRQVARSN